MTQHNFENDNKYHERSVQARKSTLVSVVVNIFLSALQVVVGIFSGSQGLIADGMHSFSDLVADGVVLMANKKSVDRLTTITTMATGAMRTAPP
ncbi:Cobalt-zinc-cadmium resistance protein [Klebsiella pneumoniae IS43]|uniref:Cobalt-zinc-cadmium resistance protein n=1 Tax=Klebsiella pneumoniae IS43 TaxID=1432552 RepID=W1DNY8_KLEPN|nr:Cobalt-zinc-cadmium resistance protein [Klebsiella pneumoniae IS43]